MAGKKGTDRAQTKAAAPQKLPRAAKPKERPATKGRVHRAKSRA
jgi:hypothetical protein